MHLGLKLCRWACIALLELMCMSSVNASQPPIGALDVSLTSIPVGEAAFLTFYVAIDDPNYIAGSAILQEVDSFGKVVATLGNLNDSAAGGDLLANDKIHSARVSIIKQAPVIALYRVSAAFKGVLLRSFSDLAAIDVRANAVVPTSSTIVTSNVVTFIDKAGSPIAAIRVGITSADEPSGLRVVETKTPYMSPGRGCATIFSKSEQFDVVSAAGSDTDGLEERTLSRVQHYCNGVQIWQRDAPENGDFTFAPDDRPLSYDGSRVALVTTYNSKELNPLIEVIGNDGNTVFSSQDLAGVFEVRMSSSGEFLFVRGLAPSGGQIATISDVVTALTITYPLDYGAYKSLRFEENSNGGFSIFGDSTLLFSTP